MWVALFAIVMAIALGLAIAAFVMQRTAQHS
jgi:uncharacterized protein YneF (UPF0154 family)